ncbi:MAG: sigma-70 family RNA polymerase sigma factor [Clostridia bacterium]|nr:sigma-70 family RNA polymerase sigma factor [Clostridia bacterium]
MSEDVIEKYIINGKFDLDKIVDDYSSYVRTIINNAVENNLNAEDKEEILLDAFFILWKNYNDNKKIYALDSYIAGITRNLIKEKFRKLHYTVDISDYENIIPMDTNELYEEEREEILNLEHSLKELKQIDIKIVNLYYYSFKSIKDIAEELDISESNVKTRLHRIRKKLKKQLSKGDIS